MAFKKGQSGNPGGRPKEDSEFRELAREKSLEALKFLITTFNSKKANLACRIKAATTVLEYGQGKPLQPTKELPKGYTYGDLLRELMGDARN